MRKHSCKATRLVQTSLYGHLTSRHFDRESLSRKKSKSSDYVAKKGWVEKLCASLLIYGLRPLCAALMASMPIFKPRPAAQLTFYQQPQKVSKKGRSPATLYSLRVLTNTDRENAFPTRLSLRLHPCNRPSVSLRCSGSLESRSGRFVVRAYEKCTIDSIQEAASNKLSIPLKLATLLSNRREETSL